MVGIANFVFVFFIVPASVFERRCGDIEIRRLDGATRTLLFLNVTRRSEERGKKKERRDQICKGSTMAFYTLFMERQMLLFADALIVKIPGFYG